MPNMPYLKNNQKDAKKNAQGAGTRLSVCSECGYDKYAIINMSMINRPKEQHTGTTLNVCRAYV